MSISDEAYQSLMLENVDLKREVARLTARSKEEVAMRDYYKRRSHSWRGRALRQASLLAEVAALDDGDERFAWEHEDLFNRIRLEVNGNSASGEAE
jgi:hypothetical protein